jgi:hypothetical protein
MSEWDAYPEVQQPQGQDPWAAFPEAKAAPTQQAQPAPQEEPAPYAEYQVKPRNDFLHTAHNFVSGVTDQALKIPTFGFLDEGNAGMRAVIRGIGNLVTGKPADIGGNYDRALADERIGQDMFQEAHPVVSAAANVAGGLATGGIGAGIAPGAGAVASTGRALIPDLVAGAKSVPGMVVRSTGVGATAGAVGGFGDAEGGFQERANGAIEGAAIGGGLGALIPGVPAVSREIWDRGRNLLGRTTTDEAAGEHLARALTRDKFDLSGVGPMPTTDKPMAVVDMGGGNTRRLGRQVETTPGEGSDHATTFLNERQYGQGDRIKDDIETHISGQNRIDSVKARGDQRRTESAPLYEQANQQNVHSDRLQQFLDDPIAKEGLQAGMDRARIRSVAENQPFNPDDYASNGGPVNTRAIDAVKNGLDDILEKYRNPTTGKLELDGRGKDIEDFRKSLLIEADALNPTYGQARAAYAEPSRLMDATERGRGVMKGNTQETVRNFEKMDDPAKDAYRIGAADTLKETVGNSRDGAHVVPRIYGGDNARARVDMLADDPKAFARKMAEEDAMNKSRNTVTGGSSTMRSAADTEDAGAIKAAAISAAHGNGLLASVLTGLGKAEARSRGMNEDTAEKISKLLFSSDQAQNANTLADLVARVSRKKAGLREGGGNLGGKVQSIGNLLGQYNAPEERR